MRKYTIAELRSAFINVQKKETFGLSLNLKHGFDNRFEDDDINSFWLSWLECAQFIGALSDSNKEEI